MPHNEHSYQHTADWRAINCRTDNKLKRANKPTKCTNTGCCW